MTETTLEKKKEETVAPERIEERRPRRTFSPSIDIYETDDSVVLLANMPGVSEEKIDIALEKNQLTIRGEVDSKKPDGYKTVYSEQCVGDFQRTFSLSNEVNQEEIVATLKHGVLRLELAKTEVTKARQITVQVEN